MTAIVGNVLMIVGSFLMLVAAIGVLRMPDFSMRMHSSTKAGTLGIGMIFLSVAAHFSDLGVTTRVLAAILFLLLTAPVGAHVIGRAAYFLGTPLWEGTFIDELKQSHETKKGGRGAAPEGSEPG